MSIKKAGLFSGIIACALVIGFSITACSSPAGGGGGGSSSGPPTEATYNIIYLKAGRWHEDDGRGGENLTSGYQIKLSDFTTVRPKQYDVLRFKISGVLSKELSRFHTQIFQSTGNVSYKWLGMSDETSLPTHFNERIFDTVIYDAPDPNSVYYVELIKNYDIDSGETLGSTLNGTTMATISNFKINLVSVQTLGKRWGDYWINEENNAITINGYEGTAKNVTIPSEINGKLVTAIGVSGWLASDICPCVSVTIPVSVTIIGEHAFNSFFNLTEFKVDFGNTKLSSMTGVLFNYDKTTLIQYPFAKEGAYTIPDSVTSIVRGAFWNCYNLTSVIIPSSVTSIDYDAFGGCFSLTSVTFKGTITAGNLDNCFNGDLREKYLAGGPGTYTRDYDDYLWTKQ